MIRNQNEESVIAYLNEEKDYYMSVGVNKITKKYQERLQSQVESR